MIKPTERRQGHSKLVYNKATRTIDTVDPHPMPEGEGVREAAIKVVASSHQLQNGKNDTPFGWVLVEEHALLALATALASHDKAAVSRANAPLVIDPADQESPP